MGRRLLNRVPPGLSFQLLLPPSDVRFLASSTIAMGRFARFVASRRKVESGPIGVSPSRSAVGEFGNGLKAANRRRLTPREVCRCPLVLPESIHSRPERWWT